MGSTQSYVPSINRNLPSAPQQPQPLTSLKRKAEPPTPTTSIITSNPNPPSLLSRLDSQTGNSYPDRSTKRLKAEPTLLDRLQVPSTSSSPSPSPSLRPPSASDDDRGPGKSSPSGPTSRASRNAQRSSPYASSSDLRIKNASSTSTTSIIEPMKNTTLRESTSNQGLSVRGKAKQNGTSISTSSTTTMDSVPAISRSFSIKGAAKKGVDAPAEASLSTQRTNTPAHKPSLLERTSLASSKPKADPPKQQPPLVRQLSIQERLSAPSLVSRLSVGSMDTSDKSNAGAGGGRKRKGKGGGQH